MKPDLAYLKYIAYRLRVLSLRETTAAGSGHATSALSAADMISALFFYAMHFDRANPHNPTNDRFILSKGHAVPVVYAAWHELGVISEDYLMTLRQIDSTLEGHPTPRFMYNEAATGSLGNGLSIGLGMALSARLSHQAFNIYVMMGDSEMAEGSVWEACELAAFYKVDNLIGLIDVNRLGQSTETMAGHNLESYARKLEAFGWYTFVIDGHDMSAIIAALDAARAIKNQPSMIIARTYKGHGLDTNIEDHENFHGKAFPPKELSELMLNLEKSFPEQAHACYKPEPKISPVTQKLNFPAFDLPSCTYKKGEKKATRKAFGETLTLLGGLSDQVVSLDAEVKNSTFAELFEKKYPKRFFQCFVAEQNMVNMAIGFAARGYIPFVSTFGVFFTRAHDQIRMASIGRSNLRLAGSHAGVSIGEDGPSQMALEDIAQMRAMPDSIVLYPCDAVSTYKLMGIMANYNTGISYIRLTRADTEVIYDDQQQFLLGDSHVLRQSNEDQVCIVAAGITLYEALKAYETLKKQGILVSIVDLYCIKPLSTNTLATTVKRSQKRVVTVEDHFIEGGLGEAVCYELRNQECQITVLAVKSISRSGKPQELLAYHEIDAEAIIKAVHEQLKL